MMRTIVAAAALAATAGRVALAQSAGRPTLGFGVGAASSVMSVGDSSASGNGLTLHAAYGVFEAEYQAFATPNPLGFEEFTALSVLAGPRFGLGGGFLLRPAAGLQYRWWSGSNPVEASDWGLAVGVVVGRAFALATGWRIAPQLTLRAAPIEFEGSVTMYAVGLRVQITRVGHATSLSDGRSRMVSPAW
jgi:hypothetical protein